MATSGDPKAAMLMTLRTSDGVKFEVPEAVALQSYVIKSMTEVDCIIGIIPLFNVTSAILVKVIAYCRMHADDGVSEEDFRNWDAEFVKVDNATLHDLMEAANYMEIESLLDLTCRTVAGMIPKMNLEEIRKTFNVENDFTPEEEEEVRRENQWFSDQP